MCDLDNIFYNSKNKTSKIDPIKKKTKEIHIIIMYLIILSFMIFYHYSKHDIKKLDFVIEVNAPNTSCLPSGAFRERHWSTKEVSLVKDGVDFKRVVELKDKCDKMSLITAIARPQRLDEYLPDLVSKNYFEDHHAFTKDELEEILIRDASDSLLVTYKDFVKVESFGLPMSLLDMHVTVDTKIYEKINNYIGRK